MRSDFRLELDLASGSSFLDYGNTLTSFFLPEYLDKFKYLGTDYREVGLDFKGEEAVTKLFGEPIKVLKRKADGVSYFIRIKSSASGSDIGALALNSFTNACSISISAETEELVDNILKTFREHLHTKPPKDEVNIKFWNFAPQTGGGNSLLRGITYHKRDEIAENYIPETWSALDKLFDTRSYTEEDGKLIIWHGPPGTGKTSSIRALVKQWEDWAEAFYIIDPEAFFQHPQYMIDVLMAKTAKTNKSTTDIFEMINPSMSFEAVLNELDLELEEDDSKHWPGDGVHAYDDDDDDDLEFGSARSKCKLLILEDTDEFLTKDAKHQSGQSLSRFLNLTDGLLGQGIDTLLLLTTNEPLAALHEAVAREGRCLANIEFKKFPASKAVEWIKKKNGITNLAGGEFSLAELYSKIKNEQITTKHNLDNIGGQYL